MGFVMWAPTITVVYAAIASLKPIAARLAVFFLSVSSWASVFVLISGATTQSILLVAAALAINFF